MADNATGLLWEKPAFWQNSQLERAYLTCEGLVFGGRTDWRVPDIQELLSASMLGAVDPFEVFELSNPHDGLMSSTPTAEGLSYGVDWLGRVGVGHAGEIRCVRGP